MTLTSVVADARRDGWALGSFSCPSLEAMHGILKAAQSAEAPVVLTATLLEAERFGGSAFPIAVRALKVPYGVRAFSAIGPVAPTAVLRAVGFGPDLILIDRTEDGGALDQSASRLRELVQLAHEQGQLVGVPLPTELLDDATTLEPGVREAHLKRFASITGADLFLVPSGLASAADQLAALIGALPAPIALESRPVDAALQTVGQLGLVLVPIGRDIDRAIVTALKGIGKHEDARTVFDCLDLVAAAVQRAAEKKLAVLGAERRAASGWVRREIV